MYKYLGYLLSLWVLSSCSQPEAPATITTRRYPYTFIPRKVAYTQNKYKVNGKTYVPQQQIMPFTEVGIASFYHSCKVTSSGDKFLPHIPTAAHKTLPIPCIIMVTNLNNNRSLKLLVNDRGPFISGRVLDVSISAAKMLGFYQKGIEKVKLTCLVDESKELWRALDRIPLCYHLSVPGVSDPHHLIREAETYAYPELRATVKPLAINHINKSAERYYVCLEGYKTKDSAKMLLINLKSKYKRYNLLNSPLLKKGKTYNLYLGPLNYEAAIELKNVIQSRSRTYTPKLVTNVH